MEVLPSKRVCACKCVGCRHIDIILPCVVSSVRDGMADALGMRKAGPAAQRLLHTVASSESDDIGNTLVFQALQRACACSPSPAAATLLEDHAATRAAPHSGCQQDMQPCAVCKDLMRLLGMSPSAAKAACDAGPACPHQELLHMARHQQRLSQELRSVVEALPCPGLVAPMADLVRAISQGWDLSAADVAFLRSAAVMVPLQLGADDPRPAQPLTRLGARLYDLLNEPNSLTLAAADKLRMSLDRTLAQQTDGSVRKVAGVVAVLGLPQLRALAEATASMPAGRKDVTPPGTLLLHGTNVTAADKICRSAFSPCSRPSLRLGPGIYVTDRNTTALHYAQADAAHHSVPHRAAASTSCQAVLAVAAFLGEGVAVAQPGPHHGRALDQLMTWQHAYSPSIPGTYCVAFSSQLCPVFMVLLDKVA